jgi:serine/threonine protein kinase
VTSTYAFLGTPLYAAPEAQLRTHVGPAADRYSLGVILFHMLSGVPPFQGETPFEILNRHRTDLPPDLGDLRPETPPALRRLVSRLLDKEPDQRPEDSEILRILAEVTSGLSVPPAAPPAD